MQNLNGKKLLIISSDRSDVSFIEAARSLGVYTICCDKYFDHRISPAKRLADEAWNLDYSNINEVVEKCKISGVDGVIAGYSENRVIAACRIANAIGKPFYATEEQINITRNKRLFKQMCRENDIPVPHDYCIEDFMNEDRYADVRYPVIVKPADNGGRKGITICHNRFELRSAIHIATEQSLNGDVVVEDYIHGVELCAVYTIVDGEISLSCLNDKYISIEGKNTNKLCAFVITPSKYYEEYKECMDLKIKKLLKKMNVCNGVANFQFIANESGIVAFEMGYRINGNDDFKVIRKYNDIDFSKMLVSYSLTGTMGDSLDKDNPCFPMYNATLVLYLHEGVIGKIDYSLLSNIDNIDDISINQVVGNKVIENGTNAQKAGMIKFSAKSIEEIIETIKKIENSVRVEDIEGNDMIIPMFDADRLR